MPFEPRYLILHDYGKTPVGWKPGTPLGFNPYHALVHGGQVQYRNPDNPYSGKAPHAYKLNPQSIGLSWAGPVGGNPAPADLNALRSEIARIRKLYPDIKIMSHGEAFARRGAIPQASKSGRGLEEASWRHALASDGFRGGGGPRGAVGSGGPREPVTGGAGAVPGVVRPAPNTQGTTGLGASPTAAGTSPAPVARAPAALPSSGGPEMAQRNPLMGLMNPMTMAGLQILADDGRQPGVVGNAFGNMQQGYALQERQRLQAEQMEQERAIREAQLRNMNNPWKTMKAGSDIYRVNPMTGQSELIRKAPPNPVAGMVNQILGGGEVPGQPAAPTQGAVTAPAGAPTAPQGARPMPPTPGRPGTALQPSGVEPTSRFDFGARTDKVATARRTMKGVETEEGEFIPQMPEKRGPSKYQRAGAVIATQPGMGRAGRIIADIGSEARSGRLRRADKMLEKGATAAEAAERQINDIDIMQQALDAYNANPDTFGTGPYAPLEKAVRAYLLPFIGDRAGQLGKAEIIEELTNRQALAARDTSTGAGMPGAMSDADRQFLMKIPAGFLSSPSGNRVRNEILRRKAQRTIKMQEFREQYAAQNGGSLDGFTKWARDYNRANPIFAGLEMPGTTAPRVSTPLADDEIEILR
jgi:hypothetical protein